MIFKNIQLYNNNLLLKKFHGDTSQMKNYRTSADYKVNDFFFFLSINTKYMRILLVNLHWSPIRLMTEIFYININFSIEN